jgi:pyridoxal phosphate enzyme (YggS family)
MVDIAANYRAIVERIGEAAVRSGRDPGGVKLLAASKSQSIEKVRAAAAAGVRYFGENYVQEAAAKKRATGGLEWHMIGHLQRNKVKTALELFDVIESVDSVELARALDREGQARGRAVRSLIEVNLAGEASKSGVAKDRLGELLEAVGKLAWLRVEGLMAVPPLSDDGEKARPYFRDLAALRRKYENLNAPNIDLKELSMGMSQDYPVAVAEGATLVRIGTALFGPREQ